MILTADHRRTANASLSQFVRLPENRSAWLAIRRYAAQKCRENRSRVQPLLFLHGPAGSGKSHLANGLLEQIVAAKSTNTVQAIAAVDLGRLLTQTPGLDDPLQDLRTCDLLVIEDLQHLNPDASTGLAALLDHRQTRFRGNLVTALHGPAEFKRLPIRLTSRLAAGLVIGLEPLALASRRKLAEKLCRERKLAVTSEVIDWLARNPTGGARAILGDMHRLVLLAGMFAPPLNLATVLGQTGPEPKLSESAVQRIAIKVAEHFGVKLRDLQGKNRHRNHRWPRHVGMYLIRELTKLPLAKIGEYFGGRDRTTVLHACKKVDDALNDDVTFADELRKLRAELV